MCFEEPSLVSSTGERECYRATEGQSLQQPFSKWPLKTNRKIGTHMLPSEIWLELTWAHIQVLKWSNKMFSICEVLCIPKKRATPKEHNPPLFQRGEFSKVFGQLNRNQNCDCLWGGGWELTGKESGNLSGVMDVLSLPWHGGYMHDFICQNSSNYILKICAFLGNVNFTLIFKKSYKSKYLLIILNLIRYCTLKIIKEY